MATATLVSARTSTLLPLVGISQLAHEVVCERESRRRDDQATISLRERFLRDGFDAEGGAVGGDLDFARCETQTVAQRLRNDQPPCLVDGRPHTRTLPGEW